MKKYKPLWIEYPLFLQREASIPYADGTEFPKSEMVTH